MSFSLEELKDSLRGIYTIMVTPMKANYSLDLPRLHEHTRFLVESGIRTGTGVLLPVGAGGEGYHLTPEELLQAARTVVDAARGEVPVYPGCTLANTFAARDLCRQYQELGASGVQLSPPYYYEPSEQEYLDHYRICASAAPRLAVIAYNSWWNSIDVQPETLAKLAEIPSVIGIKWSSPSTRNYQKALHLYTERFSFIDNQITGTGPLGFMLGMKGYVSSVPNFAPHYDLALLKLLQGKDRDGALRKMEKFVIPLYEYIGKMHGNGLHGEGSHWKACCEVAGRPMGPPRPPHRPYNDAERAGLRELFRRGGLLGS
jgi:4-hydroxy-tetrahydrodipicolinate synthase